MGLVTHNAIDNDRTGFLQDAGEMNIFFFVESSAEFDYDGYLFAVSSRLGQRFYQLRRFIGAV